MPDSVNLCIPHRKIFHFSKMLKRALKPLDSSKISSYNVRQFLSYGFKVILGYPETRELPQEVIQPFVFLNRQSGCQNTQAMAVSDIRPMQRLKTFLGSIGQ